MTGPRNQPCIMTGIAIGIQPHDRTDASSHITTQTACVLARFPRLRLSPHPPPTPTQQPPPSAHGPRESVRLRAASVKLLPELIAVIMKVIGNNDHECSKFRHGCWSAWLILKKISGLPGEATTPWIPPTAGEATIPPKSPTTGGPRRLPDPFLWACGLLSLVCPNS